ncbi:MAG: GNAT family protein [Candidatus Cloacimonetes bacterium]|jgi:RimJ/RimL family protein N-acetyltransferase|nr:GNAT family protein [Candidatus Cloacimonadota bacterium]
MYIYEDIAFRVIEREDLNILRRLHNDRDTYLNLYTIDFIDEAEQLDWWSNLHKRKNDRRFVICRASETKEVLGRLRIQHIQISHQNCEIGLDILPEYRKQGFALKSYRMVLEFLFEHFNMHMVFIKVADFNPQAKRVYERVGFRETGRLPEFFYRHGKHHDYVIMSITADQYRNGGKS